MHPLPSSIVDLPRFYRGTETAGVFMRTETNEDLRRISLMETRTCTNNRVIERLLNFTGQDGVRKWSVSK